MSLNPFGGYFQPFLLTKTEARYGTLMLIDDRFCAVGCPKTSEYMKYARNRGEKVAKRIAHLEDRGKKYGFDEEMDGSFCSGRLYSVTVVDGFISSF